MVAQRKRRIVVGRRLGTRSSQWDDVVVPERKGSQCVLFCWSEGSQRNKNVTATERVSNDNRVRAHGGVKRERTLVSEEGLKCRFCDFY